MSYADTSTSVRRNVAFLTPAEIELFMPSEAELRAIDRCYAIAKQSGVLFLFEERDALQQEINARGAS